MTDFPQPCITRKIGDGSIIGDLRAAAPLSRVATSDYFCWTGARLQQLYLPDTGILQTLWVSQQGVDKVTDYMLISDDLECLLLIISRLQLLRGRVSWRIYCATIPDYARARPDATLNDGALIFVT